LTRDRDNQSQTWLNGTRSGRMLTDNNGTHAGDNPQLSPACVQG